MSFDYHLHVFHSPRFQSVVDEAVEFLGQTPVHQLPPQSSFVGSGVYALYYAGDFGPYARLASLTRESSEPPIYVGKAVPPGWRTSRSRETEAPVLYRRLLEHTRSIGQATNLDVDSFRFRFAILGGVEGDLIVPVEAALIRKYTPLWNAVIDGFGNHDPGSGRYNQARSEWDILHPGRLWSEKLTGDSSQLSTIIAKLNVL